MASIDLKDAYYSVSIVDASQKFLRFIWDNMLYQYTCLPNGLSSAPRVLTKLLKPLYSTLRLQGHVACGYINDSFLMKDYFASSENTVQFTQMFTNCGFGINYENSKPAPTKHLEHLGFILDSDMLN